MDLGQTGSGKSGDIRHILNYYATVGASSHTNLTGMFRTQLKLLQFDADRYDPSLHIYTLAFFGLFSQRKK